MAGNPRTWNAARSVSKIPGLALLLALVSCATTSHDPLDGRTLPEEKRYEFLKANESGKPPDIRDAFIDGRVVRGMPRDWVLELHGRPDRILDGGWEYLDKKGKPILAISFQGDAVGSVITYTRSGDTPAGE